MLLLLYASIATMGGAFFTIIGSAFLGAILGPSSWPSMHHVQGLAGIVCTAAAGPGFVAVWVLSDRADRLHGR
jgi:hypothetical protein